jgi:cellulose synthase (UDP-forming)
MNSFKNSRKSFLNHPHFLRIIAILSVAYLLYYLWWRETSTLNPNALIFSWILLLAEAFGVFNYLLFAFMTQDITPTTPHKYPRPGLSVDIFIPTYNENIEILEATLIGCNRISYPHKTYILDDGNREEVKQLAIRLGCFYIARPTNEHAKAGNINHALSKTSGEFIVVLDADTVPQPDYLDRTLGYFEDDRLAFVQLPQEFYNHDSIQHDKKMTYWHEQSLFYRVIQPGKNHSNSAFWCGSPSIVRRKALEDIGGVATETITEDIHTSVRLHSHGWSSLFVNEVLAYGIAPQTIKAFLLQRLRWAQGTMQLYRSAESPLWISGLSLKQRFSYLASFLAYFESFQKLILVLTPVYIILFDIFPMQVTAISFIRHWIPYFILTVLTNKIGGRGYFRYYQTEKYNLLKMIVFIQATLALFWKKSLSFKVTPKSVNSSVYREERKALRSYMAIFGFITGTLIYGMINLLTRTPSLLGLSVESFLIAYFWTAYNAILIFVGIQEILRKHHERKQYRFQVELEGEVYNKRWLNSLAKVKLNNLSIGGVNFIADKPILRESQLLLHFNTPSNESILLPIDTIHRQNKISRNKVVIGASFANIEFAQRERLFSYLFTELPARNIRSTQQKDILQLAESKLPFTKNIPVSNPVPFIGKPVLNPVHSKK